MDNAMSLRDRVLGMADTWRAGHYSKADRREYALAVMEATIEACAKECEGTDTGDMGDWANGFYEGARACADACRALSGATAKDAT